MSKRYQIRSTTSDDCYRVERSDTHYLVASFYSAEGQKAKDLAQAHADYLNSYVTPKYTISPTAYILVNGKNIYSYENNELDTLVDLANKALEAGL